MTRPVRRPMCTCGIDHKLCIQGRYTIDPSGCWIWSGVKNRHGYGQVSHLGHQWLVHRMSYWAHIGDFPAELDLDHLCRTRDCINPAHLEPVTRRENILRSDSFSAVYARRVTCANGHPLTPNPHEDNSLRRRRCVTCMNEKRAAWAKANPPLNPGDPRHGSLYAYQSFNCRCDLCMAEATRRRHLRHPPKPKPIHEHGTRNCYRAGCKCTDCLEANAAHARTMRQRRTDV